MSTVLVIDYYTQSVIASENKTGWHQWPFYQTNKSKCNQKKLKKAKFSEGNLSLPLL